MQSWASQFLNLLKTQTPPNPIESGSKNSWAAEFRLSIQEVMSTSVHPILKRVWWVDIQTNLRCLPLQALSMLVFPIFWTLPKILELQLSVPIAISKGLEGNKALDQSREIMRGFSKTYGWPFIGIIVGLRVVDGIRNVMLALMPPRFWQEVIEIPALAIAVCAIAKVFVCRMQDVLPIQALEMRERV